MNLSVDKGLEHPNNIFDGILYYRIDSKKSEVDECKSCNVVLDEPIELECKHPLCCLCCFRLLKSNLSTLPCPTCGYGHQ